MAFPQRTKYLRRPIGWKDKGRVGEYLSGDKNVYLLCGICAIRARVGKEDSGEVFLFCPRCDGKIKRP